MHTPRYIFPLFFNIFVLYFYVPPKQVILSSEGFSGAKDLASKIVSMFTLSKQLLSTQQHYDWGLRALKAVLNTGGKLIQVANYLVCAWGGVGTSWPF